MLIKLMSSFVINMSIFQMEQTIVLFIIMTVCEFRNMALLCEFPGGQHCRQFFLITAQVELAAVPGLKVTIMSYYLLLDEIVK